MMSVARLPRVVFSVGVVALLGLPAFPANAATTTYNGTYLGGTIAPGDTVVLGNAGQVTGNVVANGTLQVKRLNSGTLTISSTISGTGTLMMTSNAGLVLNLTGTTAATNTVVLDMTTTASAGTIQIRGGNGSLRVGGSGTGTLNVTGGYVDNFEGYLGYSAGSVGTATVSSGRWDNGPLSVGGSGNGTLNVTGGQLGTSSCTIGTSAGGVGTATVSEGLWLATGNLFVGSSGTGTLNVTGGRVINSSSYAYLGYRAGGVGTVTVSSGTWTPQLGLSVGGSGNGTLNVSGGYVSNNSGTIGTNAGGFGTATVSSGTWLTFLDLSVGSSGTGTLSVNGGLVTVGGTLSTGTYGTINVNTGGTLQIGTGTTRGVLATNLANNGTLIFNRSDASTYSGVLSGSGGITKQGAGLLTFAGANSYSGVTTISGGTIALSGTGSIGTGGLNLGTAGSPCVFDIAAVTAGTYSLSATGTLAGVGTLSGSGKSLAVLGSFLPGNCPGTVTLDSGFTLDLSNSGSSLFEITDPAYTAGTYDLVSGDGSVVFGGILNLNFSGGTYTEGTDVLQLFANTGGRSGNFSAVNATGLAAGQLATFNPVTGFISVVPEPSTCASLLAGLACGGYSMFRRRKRA